MTDVTAAQFVELNGALKRENYAKAVEICNKIRARLPDDVDAVKTKCVALIHLEKFDKALELAAKYDFLATERTYCLYRLKQDADALALLPIDSDNLNDLERYSPALLHLAAQLHYRQGNFATCIRLYEHLVATTAIDESDEHMELQTNLLAAYAAAKRSHDIDIATIATDDSYEVAFNKSLLAVEQQEYVTAEQLLMEAEQLCRDACAADNATATETETEVAVIKTQQAFVKHLQGDIDGALSDYRNVLKLKLNDPAISAVAHNNIVTIRKDRDLLDSLKRLKTISDETMRTKLSFVQHEAILTNKAIVLCLLNKSDESRDVVKLLQQRFPHARAVADIVVLLATADQSPAAAIAVLENDNSVSSRIGLAHIYVQQSHFAKAAATLETIQEIAHTPGTVATLVALFQAAGDAAGAQRVLNEALAAHRAQDFASTDALLLREGDCRHKLDGKQFQAAAAAYTDLLEGANAADLDPELRLRSLASLVVALSYCDAQAASTRCAMLPSVAPSNDAPHELEERALRSTRLLTTRAVATDKTHDRKRAAKDPEVVARKRAKRRDAFLAKLQARPDFNALIGLLPPDPERWIPKKQRSHGKRGRRGRNANRFVGAQGAGSATDKDALKLDAAARVAAKATSVEKPVAVLVTDSSAVLRKSKKKKRR